MASTIGISRCQVAVSSLQRAARSVIGEVSHAPTWRTAAALPAVESRCYHRWQSRALKGADQYSLWGKVMLQLQSKLALCSLPFALCAVGSAFAQQDFSVITIKTNKLTDNLYYLDGVGGNAGGNVGVLIGDDGVLMIDDQFAPLSEKLQAAIKALSNKPIRMLINTHVHGDHTGGNENFG